MSHCGNIDTFGNKCEVLSTTAIVNEQFDTLVDTPYLVALYIISCDLLRVSTCVACYLK